MSGIQQHVIFVSTNEKSRNISSQKVFEVSTICCTENIGKT